MVHTNKNWGGLSPLQNWDKNTQAYAEERRARVRFNELSSETSEGRSEA